MVWIGPFRTGLWRDLVVQRPSSTDPLPTGGLTVIFPTNAPVDTGTTYYSGEIGVALSRGDVQKFSVAFHKAVV